MKCSLGTYQVGGAMFEASKVGNEVMRGELTSTHVTHIKMRVGLTLVTMMLCYITQTCEGGGERNSDDDNDDDDNNDNDDYLKKL